MRHIVNSLAQKFDTIDLYDINDSTDKEFPKPIPFRKLIGPSFVILALGLGSGEVILWPYLASNYGLGIAWGGTSGHHVSILHQHGN